MPAPPEQISIAFKPRWLQGLTLLERTRVLEQLKNLLTLAAGLAIERRG
jgi:hypothetical protein